MPALIYSPGVRVYIATAKHGTLDVSEDLTDGTMVRRSDGVSTLDFSIMNARRKYDQVFAPNDRIIVMMKRITWVRVFTGYLNSVPLRTAWPRDVPLSASCSLKRLQYYYWDPYAVDSIYLMRQQISGATDTSTGAAQGGATSRMIIALLRDVVGWPAANIHLGSIPDDWFVIAARAGKRLKGWSDEAIENFDDYIESIGGAAVINGTPIERIQHSLESSGGGGQGLGLTQGFGDGAGDAIAGGSSGVIPPSSGDTPSSSGVRASVQGINKDSVPGALSGASRNSGTSFMVGGSVPLNALPAGTYGGQSLSAKQVQVAIRMYNAAAKFGLDYGKGKVVAPHNFALWAMFMAAAAESSLDNTATNGLGYYGLFQMDRNKLGGSVKARTNIDRSIREWFMVELYKESGRNTKAYIPLDSANSMGKLCQAIERSDKPGQYAKWFKMAKDLTYRLNLYQARKATNSSINPFAGRGGPGYRAPAQASGRVSGAAVVNAAIGLNRAHPNLPYVWGGGHGNNPLNGVDCSGFVTWAVKTASGGKVNFPGTSSSMRGACRSISVAQALKTPGALLFSPGHVEISVGNGRQAVGARNPNIARVDQVGVHSTSAGSWTGGGLMPGVVYNGKAAASGDVSGGSPVTQRRVYPVPSHKGTSAVFGQTGSWSRYHTGTDFPAPMGTKVVAAQGGKVIHAGGGGREGGWAGNYVVIQHSGNEQTVYAHLSSVMPGINGKTVQGGDKIGEVGNTGRSYGSHLHFEVRKPPYRIYEGTINPLPWLRGSYQATPGGSGSGGGFGSSGGGGQGLGLTGNIGSLEPVGYVAETYADSPTYDASSPIDQMFDEQKWVQSAGDTMAQAQSQTDYGAYTLAHDSTVLQYLMSVCASSMRSFCSAPNGDFIAWFPDYYGLWGTAGILRLQPIEIQDFNVTWSDDNFVTHQFMQIPLKSMLDPGTGLVTSEYTIFAPGTFSSGIANIDAPEIMAALFGFPPDNGPQFAQYIYKRFGARPNMKQTDAILSKEGEYFMALFYFMLQWSYQYQATIPTTFMPEAFPGMLIQIPFFNFQAYITSVTHQFQFGEGGGFNTSINIASPAYMPSSNKDHSLIGLPIAGGYRKGKLLSQDYQVLGPEKGIGDVVEHFQGTSGSSANAAESRLNGAR